MHPERETKRKRTRRMPEQRRFVVESLRAPSLHFHVDLLLLLRSLLELHYRCSTRATLREKAGREATDKQT